MNLFQKMWMEFKLAYFSSQEKLTFNKDVKIRNSDDMIMRGVEATPIESKEEKQIAWFTRQNNLVEEFIEDEPIVYESDGYTVKRQNQYGWEPSFDKKVELKVAKVEGEEDFVDDVNKTADLDQPTIVVNNNAEFLSDKEKFELKWTKLQLIAQEQIENREARELGRLQDKEEAAREAENKKEW